MAKDWGVSDRQVAYWESVGVPASVAKLQAEWERRQAIVRMRKQGMKLGHIAAALNRSKSRVGQIIQRHERMLDWHPTPPVLAYLTRPGELLDLTRSARTMKLIDQLATGKRDPQRDWMKV